MTKKKKNGQHAQKKSCKKPPKFTISVIGRCGGFEPGARRFQIAQRKLTRTLAGLPASLILQNRMKLQATRWVRNKASAVKNATSPKPG